MVMKINISIRKEILEKLDNAASEANSSRSALMTQAVLHYLEEKEKEKIRLQRQEAIQSIRNIAKKLGPWDGTEEILKWRDSH
jgi:metal-responsive CopG/Arc/MetJ family transcriptional regulator